MAEGEGHGTDRADELGCRPGPPTLSSGWAPGPAREGRVPGLTVQCESSGPDTHRSANKRHLLPEVRATRLFHGASATPVPCSGGFSRVLPRLGPHIPSDEGQAQTSF